MTILDKLPGWRSKDVAAVTPSSSGQHMTTERVEQVFEDGKVQVRGVTVARAGVGFAKVGSKVSVLWRSRAPIVAYSHEVKKAKFGQPPSSVALGLIEELHAQVDESIWIRNHDQFKPISFVNALGVPANSPVSLGLVGQPRWGKGHADYFVVDGSLSGERAIAVYRLNRRERNEPYLASAVISAQLVQLYNLATDPLEFGTATLTGTTADLTQSGSVTQALKYVTQITLPSGGGATDSPFPVSAETFSEFAGVAPNGDLFVAVRFRAVTNETGRTGVVWDAGSLLVNVTRSTIDVNRIAASLTSIVTGNTVSTPTCPPALGSVTVATSLGVSTADSGRITLLSLKGTNPQKPEDPALPGLFNNYLLVGPARMTVEAVRIEDPPGVVIGILVCAPLPATLKLSVIGEHSAKNKEFDSFLGNGFGQNAELIPLTQGSRTMLLWATFVGGGGSAVGPAKLRDFTKGITSLLQGNGTRVFVFSPPQNAPLIQVMQASLIFSPVDATPFNRQFFVAGHNKVTGIALINLDVLRKNPALREQAKLSRVTTPLQIASATLGADVSARQVLNSKKNLRSRFQVGPL